MRPHSLKNAIFALLASTLLVPLCAQEYATVRHIDGDAQVLGTQDAQAQPLTLNTPLMEGDTIWTGPSGRLDILLEDGTHLWMDYESRLEAASFPSLAPSGQHPLRARLWKGAMLLDVQGDPTQNGNDGITTPSAYVAPLEQGLYLIEVENVDRTMVTAIEGSCQVSSGGQTVTLGRMTSTYSEYGYGPTPPRSSGNNSTPALLAYRDQNLPRPERGSESANYLPQRLSVYASDFDDYGSWNYTASYGYVWRPLPAYAGPEWSPYCDGRWAYTPWGTTWIPFEPWGWAPSHYGRWTFIVGFGWGWVPGVVFSPAWVAWYWGDGWIGWTPYGYNGPCWGPRGWLSVNITNIYVNNITTVVIGHPNPPPATIPPILPRPNYDPPVRLGPGLSGPGKMLGPPRAGGIAGGIHLTPGDVAAYREGRVDMASLRRQVLTERPGGIGRPGLTGISSVPERPIEGSRGLGSISPGSITPGGRSGLSGIPGGAVGRQGGSPPSPGQRQGLPSGQAGANSPRFQPQGGSDREIPGYQPPSRNGGGAPSRPEQPQRYQPRPYEPPNYQPRPSQPPSYQPRPYQPPAYQLRPSEPPNYQPRPSQPPSYQPRPYQPPAYQPRPSEPPSYQPRPSQQPSYQPRPEQAPRYIPSRPEPQNQPSRGGGGGRGARKF